jgi:hypothetical protein
MADVKIDAAAFVQRLKKLRDSWEVRGAAGREGCTAPRSWVQFSD